MGPPTLFDIDALRRSDSCHWRKQNCKNVDREGGGGRAEGEGKNKKEAAATFPVHSTRELLLGLYT